MPTLPRASLITVLLLLAVTLPAAAERYDLVLEGGRVMDPETGLDAVRNVGLSGGRIARVSTEKLTGTRVLDVRGLVVAPGFIDLHQHAQDAASGRLKAFDGVTSGLEMEIGAPDVAAFLERKRGRSLINYGTTANHPAARAAAFGAPIKDPVLIPPSSAATNDPATPAQIERMVARLRTELDAGALGLGMGIQYTPGATRSEVIRMFRLAAERHVPVFTHVRSFGRIEPGQNIVLVLTASQHRQAAFEAAEFLMDYLKTSAPFWKQEEGAKESKWIEARDHDDAAAARWTKS